LTVTAGPVPVGEGWVAPVSPAGGVVGAERPRRREPLDLLLQRELLLQRLDLLLDLAAVVRLRRIAQVALVEEDGLLRVSLGPVRLSDVVEEARVVLELVPLLPGVDRLVELSEVEVGVSLGEELPRLLSVIGARGRRPQRQKRDRHRQGSPKCA
jgi:hypothetical protein